MKKISRIEAVDKQGNRTLLKHIIKYDIDGKTFVFFDKNYLLKTLRDENNVPALEDKENLDHVKVYPMVFNDELNQSRLNVLTEEEKEIAKDIIDKYNKQGITPLLVAEVGTPIIGSRFFELDYGINISDVTMTVFIEDKDEEQYGVDKFIKQIDYRIADLEQEEYKELKHRLIDKNEDILLEVITFLYSINVYKLWMIDESQELKRYRHIDNSLTLLLDALELLVKLSLDIDFDKKILEQKIYSVFESDIDRKIIKCILSKLIEKKCVDYIVPLIFANKERFKEYLKELEKIADILYERIDSINAKEIYLLIIEFTNKNAEKKLSELYNSLGCCDIDVKKYDEAIGEFERSIQLNKKNAAAYNNLAYVYSEYANLITPHTEEWRSKLQSAETNIKVAMAIREDITYYNNYMHIEYDYGNYAKVLSIWHSINESEYKYEEIAGMYYIYVLSNLQIFEIRKEKVFIQEAIDKLNIMYEQDPSSLRMYRFIFDSVSQQKLPEDKISNVIRIAFLTSQIKKSLEVFDNVKQVAYYTTPKKLQYILSDESDKEKYRIPVFDSNYMNDPNEGALLYNYIEKKVDHFNCTGKYNEISDRYIFNEEFVFLKSFSLNIDSLPMWANYGNGGEGCCVVVNSDTFADPYDADDRLEKAFETKTPKDDYSLYEVVYFDGETINEEEYPILRPLLDVLLRVLGELFGHDLQDDKVHLKEVVDYYLSTIKYLFKHDDYAYEKEVRVILYRNAEESLEDVMATDTSFPKIYVHLKNPIHLDEIILGPKVNEAYNYVPFISLKLHDMKNTDCIISKSSIDFR